MVTDARFARIIRRPRPDTLIGRTLLRPLCLSDVTIHRLLIEREAMIGLAGDLAVWKYRGTPLGYTPDSDLTAVSYAAALAGDTQESFDYYLDRIAARARLYLDVYWEGVLAVAAELLDRRRLSGGDVVDLLRRCRPG